MDKTLGSDSYDSGLALTIELMGQLYCWRDRGDIDGETNKGSYDAYK